jgi:hypothetical protein
MKTTYKIETTNGQYLRANMRDATEDNVHEILDAAAEYLGETSERETLHDDSIVQGRLVATPTTYRTVIVRANEDADDCLVEAQVEFIDAHPDLEGWDLDPQWADNDRATIALSVPAWVKVES